MPAAVADRLAPGRTARDEARAGLYVHVPFCATRCTYCDFATGTLTRERLDRYMEAIEREMHLRSAESEGIEFTSVFFGGGTPSVLPSRHIRRLFDVLRECFDVSPAAEITLEANPESIRDSLLATWAALGVNRVSVGVQSFDDDDLVTLGRIHDARKPAEAFARLRTHGFENLSLDLMFGYPGHTAERWRRTLERALQLGPDHVSAYCFVAEPCTPLGHASLVGARSTPGSDGQSDAYEALGAALEGHGFECYETSNFARPNREARHNLVYWLRRPYVGVGPSAHGSVAGRRYGNERDLHVWADGVMATREGSLRFELAEAETAEARADEIVMVGLRLSGGIHERDYEPAEWRFLMARYGDALEAAIATGRLEGGGGRWSIPATFRFVADDVIAWLAARAAGS